MSDENPSIVSHVSLGTRDLDRALRFYDAVTAPIGAGRREEVRAPGIGLVAVAYGRAFPEFWIQLPENREPASIGNGVHVGFVAADRDAVHRFHAAALAHGGHDEGTPGPRPHYGTEYYGCFVRDPDGNKLEATFWDVSASG